MMGEILIVLGLLAGVWLSWRMPTLGSAPASTTSLSVIVPARNEESNLPTLLRSLRNVAGEVIVVDDSSTDATAGVAAGFGATVITAGEPPPGWLGKPWACHRGAEVASGDALVFLDADVEVAPDAIAGVLGELDRRGGLVSVQPYHRTVSAHEELSAYFNAVSVMGVGAFTPVRRVMPSGAFGPCLATAAADYHAVGGHAAVYDRVLDDVHLARVYRAHGLPITCRIGGDAVRFRMYPDGVGQLVEGWSKNVALGAVGTKVWGAAGATAWVAATTAIAGAALGGLVRWATGNGALPVVAFAGWGVVAVQLRWILARLGAFRWWTAVGFIVPLAAFIVIFFRSVLLTVVRRRVRWRGRTIELSRAGGADSSEVR